ncbi:MAG: arsenite methyltransferase [Actinomycetota bacterium]
MTQDITEQVRARYAEAALQISATDISANSCCGPNCCGPNGSEDIFGAGLYEGTDADLPTEAVMASLGCGNPTAIADLKAGQTVLDLGSGGGLDVLLSGKRVGPTGKVYGLDMTDEMLALAEENKRKAGATNVEFLKGHIEQIPLEDSSVDVVISNCVINLSADKSAVFSEVSRVLKPGGLFAVSDVVADDSLSAEDKLERGSFVGCIAGALSFSEYRQGLMQAGLDNITIDKTHSVADGMHATIVRANKF